MTNCVLVLYLLSIVCLVRGSPQTSLGQRNIEHQIVGGKDAAAHETPFMISIQAQNWQGSRHRCGGVIIDEYNIITAAHCHAHNLIVVAGAHDLSAPELISRQVREIRTQITHENYDNERSLNDISLYQIIEPFIFNKFVQPAKLPESGKIHSGSAEIYGWGNASNRKEINSYPDILQKANLTIIPIEECIALFEPETIHDTNVCTGPLKSNLDSCDGDSGGPLVQCDSSGLYFEVVSVVSWGPSPCGDGPGVNTRVSAYIDWIENNRYKP